MNMINVFIFYLDSILFLISLYMVFPLVVYRCESWTIKKAECWRTEIGRDLATEQEKAMAPHSSTLAWKIPCTEEPGGLQSMGSLRVGHDWATSLSLFLSCIEEGNDNPLQCSCLENPRDGEPSELPSMGSHRVGHYWSDLAAAAAAAQRLVGIPWAIPFSRGFSWPRDQIQVFCTVGGFFTIWATREAPQNSKSGSKYNTRGNLICDKKAK